MDRQVDFALNADVSTYVQSMGQAVAVTQQYVDVAGGARGRVGNLSQSMVGATQSLIGFNKINSVALDTAASYQKALSGIESTATVTGRSFKQLESTTRSLARSFPIGLQGAVEVVESLQSSGIKSERQIDALGKSFVKLGAATGTYAPQMGKDFLQLSRNMGNGISQFEALSDSLTTVTKQMGASAPATVAFSKALAPIASSVGMSQTAVMGLSAAMSSLGEDGYRAANVFNKVLLDMQRTVRDGGPELKAYADVMGTTSDKLRDLVKTNPTEMLMRFTESLSKSGPEMQRTLEALGFDSVRDTRTLSALSRTDLRKAVDTSVTAYGSGSTEQGAQKAMSGVLDQAEILRETMSQTVQNLGKPLLGLAQTQLQIATKVAGVMEGATGSQAAQTIGTVGSVAGTVGGIGKTALDGLLLAALAKGGINMVRRSGLSAGFGEGRMGATAGTGMPATEGRLAGAGARVGYGMQTALMASGMTTIPGAAGQLVGVTKLAAGTMAEVGSRVGTGFYRNVLRGGLGEESIRTPEGQRLAEMQRMSLMGRLGRLEEGQVAPTRGELRAAYGEYGRGLVSPGFGGSMANLGKTAGMIGYDAARFAGSGAYMAGRGAFKGLNALGLTPAMMFTGMAIGGGMAINSSMQEGNANLDRMGDSSQDIYGKFNAFAEAAGQAGRGLVAFTQATQQATASLVDRNDTMRKALTITGEEQTASNAAGYKRAFNVTNGVSDPRIIAASLKATLGKGASPQELARAMNDVSNQFGPATAQQVLGIVEPFFTGKSAAQDYQGLIQGAAAAAGPMATFGPNADMTDFVQQAMNAAQKASMETGLAFGGTKTSGGLTLDAGTVEAVKQAQSLYEAAAAESASRNMSAGEYKSISRALSEIMNISEADQAGAGLDQSWAANPGDTAFMNGTGFNSFLKGLADMGNQSAQVFLEAQKQGLTGDYGWAAGSPESVKQSMEFAKTLEVATNTGSGFSESLYEASQAAATAGTALKDLPNAAAAGLGSVGKSLTALAQQTNAKNEYAAGKAILDEVMGRTGGNAVQASGMLQANLENAPTTMPELISGLQSAIQQLQTGPSAMAQATNPQAFRNEQIKAGWQAQQIQQYMPSQMNSAMTMQISSGQQAQAGAMQDAQSKLMAYGQLQAGIAAASRSAGVQMGAIARDGRLKEQWATEDYEKNRKRARQDYNIQVAQMEKDHKIQLGRMDTEYRRSERYAAEDQALTKRRALRDFNTQMDRMDRDFKTSQTRAQRDYDTAVARANRDFTKSQARAEEDYTKQRARANEDYQKSMARAQRDFGIQQTQATEDYNKTRVRAQADYDKQMSRMVEDAAKSMYDPWKRRQAQMVMDAGQLVYNLKDQTKALNQQVANLSELRSMGLSEQAIKNLSLTDSNNAQQVARLLGDAKGNAEFISQINDEVAAKQTAATPLATDAGNTQYSRAAEDFATQMSRMAEDFTVAQTRSQEAFDRSMSDSAVDFGTSMSRMADDYSVSVARAKDDFAQQMLDQAVDFQKSMNDATADYLKTKADAKADFDKGMADLDESYALSRIRAAEQYHQQVLFVENDHDRALKRMAKAFGRQMKRAEEDFDTAIERMRIQTRNAISDVGASLGASIQSMKESFANMFEVVGAGEEETAKKILAMYDALGIPPEKLGEADRQMIAWAEMVLGHIETVKSAIDGMWGDGHRTSLAPEPKPTGNAFRPTGYPENLPPRSVPMSIPMPAPEKEYGHVVLKWLDMGKQSWEGFVKGFTTGMNDGSFLTALWNGLVGGVKALLGVQSPSTVFAEIGRNVMEGLGKGIKEMAATAWQFVTAPIANLDIIGKVYTAWSETGKWLGNLGSTITSLMKSGWDKLTEPLAGLDIGGKLSMAWATAGSWLGNLGGTITGLISGAWANLTAPIANLNIKEAVTGAFKATEKWLGNLVKDGPDSIITWVGEAWKNLTKNLPTMEQIKQNVIDIFVGDKGLSGWLRSLPETIKKEWLPDVSFFTAAFGSIKAGIKTVLHAMVEEWNKINFGIKIDLPVIQIPGFGIRSFSVPMPGGKSIDFGGFNWGGATVGGQKFDTGDLVPQIPNPFALGGIATREMTGLIAEAGYPEAVIPLNERGAEFMANALTRYTTNTEARGAMVQPYATPTYNTWNYSYDQSTQFTGAITVQAQNPEALAAKLEARRARQRLTQPVGSTR